MLHIALPHRCFYFEAMLHDMRATYISCLSTQTSSEPEYRYEHGLEALACDFSRCLRLAITSTLQPDKSFCYTGCLKYLALVLFFVHHGAGQGLSGKYCAAAHQMGQSTMHIFVLSLCASGKLQSAFEKCAHTS